ncbi:MAG TPA: hypothetical protein VGR28_05175 [Candidatus Thermoplasmatota archaeon]|jgi:hypothetical protein|nr:hypothetical protein [Candidatus Thermoplasmatota archaeon]
MVQPVPPVQVEQLRGLPEPVRACPECGFLNVHAPKLDEGGLPGISEVAGMVVCTRCHYRGIPAEFDTREDYADFVQDLQSTDA